MVLMFIYLVLVGLSVVLTVLYIYLDFKKSYKFWKQRNIPYLEPEFPWGNTRGLISKKRHISCAIMDLYDKLKGNGSYAGFYQFNDPTLLITTPEMAKQILIKDFPYFMDHGVYHNAKDDPLSGNLFFLEGAKWKTLRAKLSPTFSTGRLRNMFHTVVEASERLVDHVDAAISRNEELEMKDLFARLLTDVISSVAFGLDTNSLDDPNNEFRVTGRKVFVFSKFRVLKLIFATSMPQLARKLRIRFTDEEISDFYFKVVRDTIEHREKHGVRRNDFMQLLIDLMNKGYLEGNEGEYLGKMDINEVTAQAFIFFFAGFETSSNTLTFALHFLANNPHIQQRAREEVETVLSNNDGKFSYDSVSEMNYIEHVLEETLRMFPPIANLPRIATKDYKLPCGEIIHKGQRIMIPVMSMQNDPDIFPDPKTFNPDRFYPERLTEQQKASFMPFGGGNRLCIGSRFAMLQMRLEIAILVKHFRLHLSEKTINPVEIDPFPLMIGAKGGVWIRAERL